MKKEILDILIMICSTQKKAEFTILMLILKFIMEKFTSKDIEKTVNSARDSDTSPKKSSVSYAGILNGLYLLVSSRNKEDFEKAVKVIWDNRAGIEAGVKKAHQKCNVYREKRSVKKEMRAKEMKDREVNEKEMEEKEMEEKEMNEQWQGTDENKEETYKEDMEEDVYEVRKNKSSGTLDFLFNSAVSGDTTRFKNDLKSVAKEKFSTWTDSFNGSQKTANSRGIFVSERSLTGNENDFNFDNVVWNHGSTFDYNAQQQQQQRQQQFRQYSSYPSGSRSYYQNNNGYNAFERSSYSRGVRML